MRTFFFITLTMLSFNYSISVLYSLSINIPKYVILVNHRNMNTSVIFLSKHKDKKVQYFLNILFMFILMLKIKMHTIKIFYTILFNISAFFSTRRKKIILIDFIKSKAYIYLKTNFPFLLGLKLDFYKIQIKIKSQVIVIYLLKKK